MDVVRDESMTLGDFMKLGVVQIWDKAARYLLDARTAAGMDFVFEAPGVPAMAGGRKGFAVSVGFEVGFVPDGEKSPVVLPYEYFCVESMADLVAAVEKQLRSLERPRKP